MKLPDDQTIPYLPIAIESFGDLEISYDQNGDSDISL